MSTQFQHKKIYKRTWMSPDHNTINQIDHILVNQNKKEVIEDVRPLQGPSIDSDLFLLKATIKQKLPYIYKRKPIPLIKWNRINLQIPVNLDNIEYRYTTNWKIYQIRIAWMRNGKE